MQNKKKVNNIEYTIQKKCKSTAIKNQEIALTEKRENKRVREKRK